MHRIAAGARLIDCLAPFKGKALNNMSASNHINSRLDNSISFDGKDTSWSLPVIPEVSRRDSTCLLVCYFCFSQGRSKNH